MGVAADQQPNDKANITDARLKLSDVLANIRSGKIEEEYDYDDDNDQEFASPPQKRRHTTNYVALSGIQRRTRSTEDSNAKGANKSFSASSSSTQSNNVVRPSTFVLKLFDRTIDLAQFSHADANEDGPLYPVCRSWVLSQQINQDSKKPPGTNKLLMYPPNQDGNQDAAGVGNVYRLPKPLDNKVVLLESGKQLDDMSDEKIEQINLRIPESVRNLEKNLNVQETLDKLIDSKNGDNWSNNDRLLENRKRWRQVREDWKAAAKLNESRYDKSAKILRDIYMSNTVKHSEM